MQEIFDHLKSHLISEHDKAHNTNTVRTPCEWHDVFTHWSLNVICINFGGFCMLWFVVFINISLWILKTQWKHMLFYFWQMNVQMPVSKGWFHFLYWYSTSTTQTPPMDIFLLISVSLLYLDQSFIWKEIGMYVCKVWWMQEVELCVWMTVWLTWLDEVYLGISLFLPKTDARQIFYIHVYCWCLGGILVT